MRRMLGGALLGYAVLIALVFGFFDLAYRILGPESAFQPGTYDATSVWITLSFVLGFLAAVAGGSVAAAVANGDRGPALLAGLVIVLGLVLALLALQGGVGLETVVPDGDVSFAEALQNARQPTWVTLVNPLVGAFGVVVGGRLRRAIKSKS